MSSTSGHFLDLPAEDLQGALEAWLQEQQQPSYRSQQILHHLLTERRLDPQEMTSLPVAIRQGLGAGPLRPSVSIDAVQESRDGTRKYRFRLGDDRLIESVWIPSGNRGTLCVSSQVGCAAACTFCATGTLGLGRNLFPREIVSQWLAVVADTTGENKPGVTQLVFMGMGEPLHNYPALSTALTLITDRQGFRFSPRRITVSTVGIIPKIRQLVADHPQVRLAVSLHSAVESTRNEIVPINSRHGLDELSELLVEIREETRRISLEYVVLPGVNDSAEEARALAAFAERSGSHINLLPFHPFEGAPFEAAAEEEVARFLKRVEEKYDGPVTARRSRGLDIDGACGQLVVKTGPDRSK